MTRAADRSRTVTIVSTVVALAFLAAGTGKLVGAEPMVETFAHFGFGPGFMRFIGAAEVAGAIGVLLPRLAPVAAAGLALVMSGAVAQHLLHDPLTRAVPAAALLLLCASIAWSRRAELLG